MGVAAARRSGAGSVRRLSRMRGGSLGRAASASTLVARRTPIAPPAPHRLPDDRRSFWSRLDDDRRLIRLKVLLLASLLLLAALLEWVA